MEIKPIYIRQKTHSGKQIVILLIAILLLVFCACGNNQNTDQKHTYAELTERQKSEVDYLLGKMSETISDSGDTIPCSHVFFTHGDDGSIHFCVSYGHSGGHTSISTEYAYDVSKNIFSQIDYSATYYEGMTISPSWSSSWSNDEKRDYIANAMWEILNSK